MKKKTTKCKFLTALTLAFAMLLSCIMVPATENTAHAAAKLTVTAPKTVTVGKTVKVKTNISCKFKSSNTQIATVSSKGTVKGKKAGVVKITATSKKYPTLKKTVKITVKKAGKAVPVSIASAKYRSRIPASSIPSKHGVILKVKYSDGTTKTVDPKHIDSFQIDDTDANHQYYTIGYGKLSTKLTIETVDLDESIVYPTYAFLKYVGKPIKTGQEINPKDITGTLLYSDGTEADVMKYLDLDVMYEITKGSSYISYGIPMIFTVSYKGETLFVYLTAILSIPYTE